MTQLETGLETGTEASTDTLAVPSKTALADFLPTPESGAYLGVLTPTRLDALERETEALLTGAGVHDLGWLHRIAVRGEDRFRWLSGMVTNGVESLMSGHGAYNVVLNAQGRIQGDCCVWRDGDALELELAANQTNALLSHFDRFIIMDDVELVPRPELSALGLSGPRTAEILSKLGLAELAEPMSSMTAMLSGMSIRIDRQYSPFVPRYAIWAAREDIPALWQSLVEAGASPVGFDAVEVLRIIEGTPMYGVDIQSRDLAQETSQDRALSFTKGCYLGQEIVERIRSRGQVHRHLRALEIFPEAEREAPAVGTELRLAGSAPDSKPVGILTSSTSVTSLKPVETTRTFAIGMIRAEAEVGVKTLTYAGGSATILHSTPKFNAA